MRMEVLTLPSLAELLNLVERQRTLKTGRDIYLYVCGCSHYNIITPLLVHLLATNQLDTRGLWYQDEFSHCSRMSNILHNYCHNFRSNGVVPTDLSDKWLPLNTALHWERLADITEDSVPARSVTTKLDAGLHQLPLNAFPEPFECFEIDDAYFVTYFNVYKYRRKPLTRHLTPRLAIDQANYSLVTENYGLNPINSCRASFCLIDLHLGHDLVTKEYLLRNLMVLEYIWGYAYTNSLHSVASVCESVFTAADHILGEYLYANVDPSFYKHIKTRYPRYTSQCNVCILLILIKQVQINTNDIVNLYDQLPLELKREVLAFMYDGNYDVAQVFDILFPSLVLNLYRGVPLTNTNWEFTGRQFVDLTELLLVETSDTNTETSWREMSLRPLIKTTDSELVAYISLYSPYTPGLVSPDNYYWINIKL